jgi:hypothetical protein
LISWLIAAEERIFITELLSLFIGKYDQTTERKKGRKKERKKMNFKRKKQMLLWQIAGHLSWAPFEVTC